jgi:hypothetical protein
MHPTSRVWGAAGSIFIRTVFIVSDLSSVGLAGGYDADRVRPRGVDHHEQPLVDTAEELVTILTPLVGGSRMSQKMGKG